MIKNISTIISIALLITLTLVGVEFCYTRQQPELPPQKEEHLSKEVRLSFNPKKGDIILYAFVTRFSLNNPISHNSGKISYHNHASFTNEVISTSNKNSTIKTTIHTIQETLNTPSTIKIREEKEFNLSSKVSKSGNLVELLDFDHNLQKIATNQGSIFLSHQFNATSLFANPSTILCKYPPKPVKVGDTWLQSGSFKLQDFDVRYTFENTLSDIRDELVYINGKNTFHITSKKNANIHGIIHANSENIFEESTGYLLVSDMEGRISQAIRGTDIIDFRVVLHGKMNVKGQKPKHNRKIYNGLLYSDTKSKLL